MHNKMLFHTYNEIFQQPDMWLKEFQLILKEKVKIQRFVSKYLNKKDYEIILTGAGTSAFIGNVLSVVLPQMTDWNCRAISSTDLVTHPNAYISKEKKIILISFARSGNSPESIGAVNTVNSTCKNVKHIIITCNEDGELLKIIDKTKSLVLLLPPETNDKSLAMTSSFSTMMLSCILLANIFDIENQLELIQTLSNNAKHILESYENSIKNISERKYKRAVFLGSGELKGVAQECHLKLQELTDGQVICKFDSFLGFRHGPKAVINSETVIIYLFSNDEFVRQFEIDLVKQININNKVVAQIAISQNKISFEDMNFDLEVNISDKNHINSEYDCIPYVLVGQLMGLYKSIDLGLNPDSPSISGNISRVVEGVTIYTK